MTAKVLIAEDDLLNSVFYEALFSSADYTTRAVRDGAYVLDAVREFDPDVILMDINMPNVSGLTLIRQIRRDAKLRGKPILAVTAYSDKVDRQVIEEAGIDGFLVKPARGAEILEKCDELVRQRVQ